MLSSKPPNYIIDKLIHSSDQVNIYRVSEMPAQQGSAKKQSDALVKLPKRNCYRIKFGHLRLAMLKLDDVSFEPHIKSSNFIDLTHYRVVDNQHLEFITQSWEQSLEEFLGDPSTTLHPNEKSQLLNDLVNILGELDTIGCRFRIDANTFSVINNRLLVCPQNILLLLKSNKEEGTRLIDHLTKEQRTSCFYISEIAELMKMIVTAQTHTSQKQTEAQLQQTFLDSIDSNSRKIVKDILDQKEVALKNLLSCKFIRSDITLDESHPFGAEIHHVSEDVIVKVQPHEIATNPRDLAEPRTKEISYISEKSPPQEKAASTKQNSIRSSQTNTPPAKLQSNELKKPDSSLKQPWDNDACASNQQPILLESYALPQTNQNELEESLLINTGDSQYSGELNGIHQHNPLSQCMFDSFDRPLDPRRNESVVLENEVVPGRERHMQDVAAHPISEQQMNNFGNGMKKMKLKEIKTSKCIDDEVNLFRLIESFYNSLDKLLTEDSKPPHTLQQVWLVFLTLSFSEFNDIKAALKDKTNRFSTKDFNEFIETDVSSCTRRFDELISNIKPIMNSLMKKFRLHYDKEKQDSQNPFEEEPGLDSMKKLLDMMNSARELLKDSKGLTDELFSNLKLLVDSMNRSLKQKASKFEEDCRMFTTYVWIYLNKRNVFNFACPQAKEHSSISWEVFVTRSKDPVQLEKLSKEHAKL